MIVTMRLVRTTAMLLALAVCPALAQTGTVVGRVVDVATGAPVIAAQVAVKGASAAVLVDRDGRFRLTSIPAGPRVLVARALGYTPVAIAFTVAPDGSTTVDVSMAATSLELDAIIVTGAVGDTRRRAVGNSVAVVNASEIVGRSAVTNLTELLQAKVPSLTLFPPSGTVGTAASYRLRGVGSLSANNSPTMYVDGVRVSARDQGSYGVIGQVTTSLDAINPSDVESVEVIKGPSAATLYGGEAAAGVIQIFTKRGRPGRIAWASRADIGWSDWDEQLRPMNFAIVTADRLADPLGWPGLVGRTVGDIVSHRALSDGSALRTGMGHKLYLSASGGADRYDFFISAGKANEDGVQFNNFSNLASLRGNFAFVPASNLTVVTRVAVSHNHVRLPLNDGAAVMSLLNSSYLAAPGRLYVSPGGPDYSTITPELANRYDNQTRADRYIVGASAEYVPVPWFKNAVHVGLDANAGQAELYFAPDPQTPFMPRASLERDNAKGLIAQGRPLNRDVTLNYDGTVTHQWSNGFVSNSSIGVQYLSNVFRRTDAIGVDLGSVGLRSVSAAAVKSGTDSSSEQKSLGLYVQQQLSLADRLFVTAAARVDNNSAFGSALRRVIYPKASVSYVISDESFFTVPGISSLRLRAAWGQAGNSPGPFDAARTYTAAAVTYSDGSSSALRYGSAGNPNLRPERGTEVEVGFEGGFFGERLTVDASYYDKSTRDALIPVPVPPSTGFTGDQLTNLGEISNRGGEVLLRAVPVQRKAVTVDATLSLAANRNRLVSFGDERSPILFGFNALTQRFQEGYPLGAMWAQRVQYNEDGSLLTFAGRPRIDTASVYMGPITPTREIALSGGILLFGQLRFFGLADYRGGHYQFNVKDWRRDRDGVSWETVNPAADPDEVMVRQFPQQTFLHIQRADFVKLRDLSLSYDVPARVLRGVARRATLTVAGHNLKIWTRYGGADPEVNYSGPGRFNRDDSWAVPQLRRYSATVALDF